MTTRTWRYIMASIFPADRVHSTVGSAASENGPKGLHVVLILTDRGINGERLRTLWPDAVAQRGEGGVLEINAIAQT